MDTSTHPAPTRAAVLGLLAAVDGLPRHVGFTGGGIDEEAWARLADTLDAMAWLDPANVEKHTLKDGRAWEEVSFPDGDETYALVLSGPIGSTPISDRITRQEKTYDEGSPAERLASRHLAEDAVVVPFPARETADDDAPLGAA